MCSFVDIRSAGKYRLLVRQVRAGKGLHADGFRCHRAIIHTCMHAYNNMSGVTDGASKFVTGHFCCSLPRALILAKAAGVHVLHVGVEVDLVAILVYAIAAGFAVPLWQRWRWGRLS